MNVIDAIELAMILVILIKIQEISSSLKPTVKPGAPKLVPKFLNRIKKRPIVHTEEQIWADEQNRKVRKENEFNNPAF